MYNIFGTNSTNPINNFTFHPFKIFRHKKTESVVKNFETTTKGLSESEPHLVPHGISVCGLVGHILIHKTETGIVRNELLLAGQYKSGSALSFASLMAYRINSHNLVYDIFMVKFITQLFGKTDGIYVLRIPARVKSLVQTV